MPTTVSTQYQAALALINATKETIYATAVFAAKLAEIRAAFDAVTDLNEKKALLRAAINVGLVLNNVDGRLNPPAAPDPLPTSPPPSAAAVTAHTDATRAAAVLDRATQTYLTILRSAHGFLFATPVEIDENNIFDPTLALNPTATADQIWGHIEQIINARNAITYVFGPMPTGGTAPGAILKLKFGRPTPPPGSTEVHVRSLELGTHMDSLTYALVPPVPFDPAKVVSPELVIKQIVSMDPTHKGKLERINDPASKPLSKFRAGTSVARAKIRNKGEITTTLLNNKLRADPAAGVCAVYSQTTATPTDANWIWNATAKPNELEYKCRAKAVAQHPYFETTTPTDPDVQATLSLWDSVQAGKLALYGTNVDHRFCEVSLTDPITRGPIKNPKLVIENLLAVITASMKLLEQNTIPYFTPEWEAIINDYVNGRNIPNGWGPVIAGTAGGDPSYAAKVDDLRFIMAVKTRAWDGSEASMRAALGMVTARIETRFTRVADVRDAYSQVARVRKDVISRIPSPPTAPPRP